MYVLRRFHGQRFERVNSIIGALAGHISKWINLIGGSSLPFPEVCKMQGMPAMACRVEGHRGARFFPSSNPIDEAEELAELQTKRLFGLDDRYEVSVQPHSATQANQAAFRSLLSKKDLSAVALTATDGGHISHRLGLPAGTEFTHLPLSSAGIDYDRLQAIVRNVKPSLIVGGASSYPMKIHYPLLKTIADSVGAYLHADLAHTAPFIAASEHPPAFPYVDSATLDTSKSLRGPRGGILIFRRNLAKSMRYSIFPAVQSSPNQTGILAKACCLNCWTKERLTSYSRRLAQTARILIKGMGGMGGKIVFGGTDSQLVLIDLSPLGITGLEAESACERAGVLVNRNQIPGDKRSPWIGSGVRLGTTTLTILDYTDGDIFALGEALASILTCRGEHASTITRLVSRYHEPLASIANEAKA